jgi:hypothetical protein
MGTGTGGQGSSGQEVGSGSGWSDQNQGQDPRQPGSGAD